MGEQPFAAGHVFFRPGDPGDRAFLILDGEVELLRGPADRPGRFARLGPGDVFGEMSLIEERPHAATARALTAGRSAPMTRDEFERLLLSDPARCRQYLRSLFERLRSLAAQAPPTEAPVPASAGVLVPPGGPVEFPADGSGKPVPEGWAVVVHPLTRKAAETLPDEGLRVNKFPMRIGRAAAAHEPEGLDLNDLWLLDSKPYNVSRNHCEIDLTHLGLVVRDRGSHLGCLVNDEHIGGRSAMGYARLGPGDNVLVLGGRMSPYQFRVTVTPA